MVEFEGMNWDRCANGKKIIDCRKRPRTQDITNKKFKVIEPTFNEE